MSIDVNRQGGRDPHDVLGVPRGADRKHVIRAFRRKARHGAHPDTGGDPQTFEAILRARDMLLDKAHPAAYVSSRRTAPVVKPPNARLRSASPPPITTPSRETSKLAIATGVLALLGPLFWPVAIVIGHLALRQIKRTGKGGGTFVPIVLFILYVITLPVLAPILTLIVIA